MIFTVVYTTAARQDLRDIYEYIAYELEAHETAVSQVDRIMRAIRSLEEYPMRHRLYEDEPWHSKGVRVFPINNYLIFYQIDAVCEVVYIIRIMYGGRDIKEQMDET